MPISVRCSSCGQGHKAPDQLAGKSVKCRKCGVPLRVPDLESVAPAPVVEAPPVAEAPPVVEAPPVAEPLIPPVVVKAQKAQLIEETDDDEDATPYGLAAEPVAPKQRVPKNTARVRAAAKVPNPEAQSEPRSPLDSTSPSNDGTPQDDTSSPNPTSPQLSLQPLTTAQLLRRHLHWALVLALIPLAVMLLSGQEDASVESRVKQSLDQLESSEEELIRASMKTAQSRDDALEILAKQLPEQKIEGAYLSRQADEHWYMAVLASLVYMFFFMFLALGGVAKHWHVLLVGVFTSTVGLGMLLLIQFLASISVEEGVVGRGIGPVIYYGLMRLIAYSYSAAADPSNSFMASFFGYTLGVGLLEELTKSIPLFFFGITELKERRVQIRRANWRGLFIWGLASGAGFGIAEGIMYSGRYYNGFATGDLYAVRFISCVALHAIWTGSVAMTIHLKRDLFDTLDDAHDWFAPIFFVIAIPMVLHGFYDTFLKRDMGEMALLTALASFGYLALLTYLEQRKDDNYAIKKLKKKNRRRQKEME